MKNRGVLIASFLGLIVTGFLAAVPSQTVSAQICFDPQNPNKQIPCPEEDTGDGGRKKKRPTAIPSVTPSPTSTPTETPTPTPTATNSPTPTVMPTPTLVFGIFASAPGQGAGGFSCLPYAGSIPIGAGLLGLGLLTLSSRAGLLRSGSSSMRDGPSNGADGAQVSAAEAAKQAEAAEALAPSSIAAVGGIIVAVVLAIIAIIVAVFTFGAGVGRIILVSLGSGSVSTNVGTGTTAPPEGIMEAMIALFKSSVRDMRANIASKLDYKEMELSAREGHLRQDNASIDEGMAEAQEKADQSMAAANSGMEIGIIGGLVQIASSLISPSGQGSGSTAAGWIGTAVAGMGAGILGSALFGGLLGFDCISVYVLLPSGAALGMLAAIAVALLFQNQRN